MDLLDVNLPKSPEENTNPISKLFYLWIFPFLLRGSKKDLKLEDVYQSLPEDSSEKLGSVVEQKWNEEIARAAATGRKPKLWKVILRIIGFRYSLIGLGYTIDEVVLRTIQPLMLRKFIRTFRFSVENIDGDPNHLRNQYIYASALVLVTFVYAVFTQKLLGANVRIGIKTRLGVSSLIYGKILGLQKSDSEQTNIGKLCNLLSGDVRRFDFSFHYLHVFYAAPIQLGIYTYLLWNELGVSSLSAMGFCFLILPLQVLLGRFTMYYRLRIATNTDARGRFLNEVIGGIRLIKMYAWEKPFASVIAGLRKKEIKYIRGSLYLMGLAVSVDTITTKLIPFLALIVYVALGNTLTADKAFFSITIFNMITQTIMIRVPTAASQFGGLIATMKRVEDFMLTKDNGSKISSHNIEEDATQSYAETKDYLEKPRIFMNNYWSSWTKEQWTLRNLNVNLEGNKLVMIVGHVGSGKSSFLNAILSELPIKSMDDESYCNVVGRLSYASQEPWIFPASVRQNILFGLEMDEDRYRKILELCCLSDDLKQFPHGDLELVGERGVALSGGQKARVNLARAIYQNADIYLLDDPLSAVDTKVSKKLFHELINDHLSEKLRILVTHQLQYLPMADYIIVLNREGGIWGQGTYQELKNSEIDFTSLISEESMNKVQDIDELKEKISENDDISQEIDQQFMNSESSENVSQNDKDVLIVLENEQRRREEQKSVGSVGFDMYFYYFKAGRSYFTMVILFVCFIVIQALFNFTDYWLSLWTNAISEKEQNKTIDRNETYFNINYIYKITNTLVFLEADENVEMNEKDQNLYSYVYCGLMAGFIVLTVIRSILFFRYCMRISINLHNGMFQSIVRAPVKFFDDNPSGRIMNRFTKDLNQIDESLPIAFYDYINILLSLFGMLAINIAANNYIAVPALIFLVSLWKLRDFFLKTARDLKRLDAVAKSPMFTHVTMTAQGLTTIRALNAQERVLGQFYRIQDTHTSVYHMKFITNRWFAVWLEIMPVILLAVVSFGFLMFTTSKQSGNVGVAISSIINLGGSLEYGIWQSAETENHMTSVERVFEYSNLEPEAPLETSEDMLAEHDWPNDGRLDFQDVSLAYDDAKENKVLKEISFSINSKEKVGVIGRTGAGKSSLITALFRLTETCNGTILIDDVPIEGIGLHILRSRISIIPQDPFLFTGSLRYNLDPFDEFTDSQLWNVLNEVDLHHAVQNLDCSVADGGSNFSVGQRQLVCLARAILRKNKILILDEVTANCDPATDNLVQKTIRAKFSDCTILTIAHRLQTVLENDRIMVLDVGKVVEFDKPVVLMNNQESALYSMLHQTSDGLSKIKS